MPNLNVAGWWDQEDFLRSDHDLREILEKDDTKHMNYSGGGSVESRRLGAHADGSKLGNIDFGSNTSRISAKIFKRRGSLIG